MSKREHDEEMASKASPNYVPPKVRRAKKLEATKEGREVLSVMQEDLPVKMTDEERDAKISESSAKRKELAAHEATKKQVVSALKATELKLKAELENLYVQIDARARNESVTVQLEADFATNTVHFVRMDTGEEVRTRPISASERQGMIPGTEATGAPPGAEKKEDDDGVDDEP